MPTDTTEGYLRNLALEYETARKRAEESLATLDRERAAFAAHKADTESELKAEREAFEQERADWRARVSKLKQQVLETQSETVGQ